MELLYDLPVKDIKIMVFWRIFWYLFLKSLKNRFLWGIFSRGVDIGVFGGVGGYRVVI